MITSGFAHFIRFAPVEQTQAHYSLHTPTGAYAPLPILPGDVLRFLVPKSDLMGYAPGEFQIQLLPTQGSTAQPVGYLRPQLAEDYVELTLAVDSLPTAGQQVALLRTAQGVTVLGTAYGTAPTLDAYLTRLVNHFEQWPHAPVTVRRQGNLLRVRIYRAAHFNPTLADLATWRIGLGRVAQARYNTNTPAITVSRLASQLIAESDCYKLVIGSDLEPGNRFLLVLPDGQPRAYTVQQYDTPADVLAGLGLTSTIIQVARHAAVRASVELGTFPDANRNRPSLQLLFQGTVSGQDRYTLVVGSDLQAGNVFQVSAPGMTSRAYTSLASDTPATIISALTQGVGYVAVPAGQLPTSAAQAGSNTLNNANVPQCYLTDKQFLAAHTIDRYQLVISPSIRRGNQFILDGRTVEAGENDTPASVALALGYSQHPFVIELPAGSSPPNAYARRGSELSADDIAPVRIVSAPRWGNSSQCVAIVTIPDELRAAAYQLALWHDFSGAILAKSNMLQRAYTSKDTLLLRWGNGIDGPVRVFDYHYQEQGLTQQVRIPAALSAPRQKVEERQYRSLQGEQLRADARIALATTLTTATLPYSFHRALLLSLKHPVVLVDGESYRALGEYREEQATPVGQRYQASTELTLNRSLWLADTALDVPEPAQQVRCDRLFGCDFLTLMLRSGLNDYDLYEGLTIPPADYHLLAVCSDQSHELRVYVNQQLRGTYLLPASRVSRIPSLRLAPGDQLGIVASIREMRVTAQTPVGANLFDLATARSSHPEQRQGADFTDEFSDDFFTTSH